MSLFQSETADLFKSEKFIQRDYFYFRKNGNCFQAICLQNATPGSVYVILLPYWIVYCSYENLYLSLDTPATFLNCSKPDKIISRLCFVFGIDITQDLVQCKEDTIETINYYKRTLLPFFNAVSSDDSYLSAMVELNRISRIPQELILNICNRANDLNIAREWVKRMDAIAIFNTNISKRLFKSMQNRNNAFNPGWHCEEDVLKDVEEISAIINQRCLSKLYYALDKGDANWFEEDYKRMEIEGKKFFYHHFDLEY